MSDLIKSRLKFVAIVGASIFVGDLLWKFYKKAISNRMPKKWRKVGEISDLFCYPIKSCGWIRISELDCALLGPQSDNIRDRTFMVVNAKNEFVTARRYPKMVLVTPLIQGDIMTLSAPGMEDITVNIKSLFSTKPIKAEVWDEKIDAADAGDEVARWFSRFILDQDDGLRLVFYLSSMPTRDVREKNKIFETAIREDTGALHDASSYMLINEGSVAELNARTGDDVTPLQFRPNFVIKGPAAFEEDSWKWIKIGNGVVFRNVKPCTRCVFTNIDPHTGEKNPKEEPLKTLKSYRLIEKGGDSPVMGIHLGVRLQGKIKFNDAVYVNDD